MTNQSLSLVCLEMLLSISLNAQHVTGKVTTASDGIALPGVSVFVKGTALGGVTDSDGVYKVAVYDTINSTLVFSFVGYITQEIPAHGRSTIEVVLVESVEQLNEVVVTALGIPREAKALVYATQQVNTEELTEVRDANNFLNSLSGKITNAIITQSSGGVGSGSRIVLRGNRSIQNSNNALIVVDGVPINNWTNKSDPSLGIGEDKDWGGTDGASNLNPDDIESMTVLPGASAAALYGSAAGNGVIVITTKKGKTGEVSVTLNSGITSESVFVLPAVQNKYGQGLNGQLDGTSGQCWGYRTGELLFTGYMGEIRKYSAQPDNIKDFFSKGLNVNNSVAVMGGSEKIHTYLSYTSNNVMGIIPKNDLTRHAFNLRVSSQVSSKFSTDTKITYILQEINKPSTGGFTFDNLSGIYKIPRNVSLEDAKNFETINNIGIPTPTPWPPTIDPRSQSPFWKIERTGNSENRSRIMGFVQARYDITGWLNLSGRANLDKTTDQVESFAYQDSSYFYARGDFSETGINVTQKWFDLILSGTNRISKSLKVDYRAGAILQDNQYAALYDRTGGLNVPNQFNLNFATYPILNQDASHIQTQSLFAQVNLAFKGSLFLDASIRTDWVSTLPPPYTTTYPSGGISAILSDLVRLPTIIAFLKLSANYAEVGNGAPFAFTNNTFSYNNQGTHGSLSRNTTFALEKLRPELVKNLEFGMDARFKENKFGFTFFLYQSNSINQILHLPLAPATGYNEQLINAGNIQNRGLELVLNVTPVKKNKLTLDISFNLGMNRNRIVELHKTIKRVQLGSGLPASAVVEEGGRFGDLCAYRWKIDMFGRYMLTEKGMPLWSGTQEHVGNFYPKATLGLTNTIRYSRFSLRLLIDGRVGGVIVSGLEMEQAYLGLAEVTEKFREGGFRLGGVTKAGNRVHEDMAAEQFWHSLMDDDYNGAGEFFTYDATNFRVRELVLSYDVPIPSNFGIKQIRISAVGRNLFFLYRGSTLISIPGIGKRKMAFDPDMALTNGNFQGVEHSTMPSTRSIGFNVQLTI